MFAEIELPPTEIAPAGAGFAQAAGIRPAIPHARAVDDAPNGPGWRRRGEDRPFEYCPRCGIAYALIRPVVCENCGAPVKRAIGAVDGQE